MSPDGAPAPLSVLARLTAALAGLEVPYFVAGSLASSLHGEPRSTNDIDLVADLDARRAEALVADLADAFYVDADAVRDAVARRTSFHLVHLASATKVDVFLLTDEPFEVERMRTRQRVHVGDEPGLETYVDAPEHTVLRKLEWDDRGGQVSERQMAGCPRRAAGVGRAAGSGPTEALGRCARCLRSARAGARRGGRRLTRDGGS